MKTTKQSAVQSAVTAANRWREQLASVHALVMGALALVNEDDLDAGTLDANAPTAPAIREAWNGGRG